MKAVLLMVPNMIDSREGTEGEKENWKKVDEVMAKYGRLMPKLPLRTDFKRLNTYVNSPRQEFFAREFFKELDGILK
jgi:hypothetical protein